MENQSLFSSAPGRICLFGEHQDYLGLPVVAMAINLRFSIEYTPGPEKTFLIHTPDLPDSEPQILDIHSSGPRHDQDYCWGIARVLLEEGFTFPVGGELTFRSKIPVRAGCSSSSAMSAAWMRLLIEIGEHPEKELYLQDEETVAYLVYRGEKELFGGAGGMMDQYSCYLGGLIHVFPTENTENAKSGIPYDVESFKEAPPGFVLIDSETPKDTQGVLARAGKRVRSAMEEVKRILPDFDLSRIELEEFDRQSNIPESPLCNSETAKIIHDHIINRDLCRLGLGMLRLNVDEEQMGEMLSEEHRLLSETIQISTPRIDELQKISLELGALGAKINGSGGGGTLFCYAPRNPEVLYAGLSKRKIKYYPLKTSHGARVHRI